MKSYKGTIDNWYLQSAVAIFGTKRAGEYVCCGNEQDNPNGYIRTSSIVCWTPNMIETQNSIYTLGTPYAKDEK